MLFFEVPERESRSEVPYAPILRSPSSLKVGWRRKLAVH
jgi:hypothetical protein